MAHSSFEDYIQLNFAMSKHHGFNVDTLENMMPFEREAYIMMMMNYVREENERLKRQQNG
jgi:hypothetical protein